MSLTPRERILATIDHKPVDRIPTDYWGTDEVTDALLSHFGLGNTDDLWPRLGVDKIIKVKPEYVGPPLIDTDRLRVDYWGVHRAPIEYNGGSYFEMCRHPLADCETIADIEATYTWPSADWFDYSKVAEECARYPEYAIEAGYAAPFYMFNNTRGLELSLLDLVADPELVEYCEEKITDFLYEYHYRLFEAGRGRIDITQVTDDYGDQNSLLISPATFRRYFAKHTKRLIDLAKGFGIRVFHHDDGAMADLIPDLVDLGIDVLNPLQWRLPGMDPVGLKRRYGERLAFHGGIDNQRVLPFGSLADVEAEVRFCLETFGGDGTGYVLAPCHNIQAITPVQNIVHMYRVATSEGRV